MSDTTTLTGPALAAAQFFKTNPDEVLTRDDASTKFSTAVGAIDAALRPAVDAGLITVANSGDLGRVWRAGPRLKFWGSTHTTTPKRTRKAAPHLPALDASKMKVQTGVPLPIRASGKGSTRYDDVFDKLQADGQSITGIPIAYYGALNKASQTYLAQRPHLQACSVLRVRKLTDDTLGVWRVAKDSPDGRPVGGRPPAIRADAKAATTTKPKKAA